MAIPSDNLEQLVRKTSVEVGATEAAGFAIEHDAVDGFRLDALVHLRPDESDAPTRAAAVAAFKEIILPQVQNAEDAVIEIEGSDNGAGTQFCLVTLARRSETVVGACALIVRCRDRREAQIALMRAQRATSG